jgi:hypothetical protein
MKNSRTQGSVTVVIIVILVIAVIGALGLVYWKNNAEKESIGNNGLLTPDSLRNTEDWLVYEDDVLPFIFDYPKDWRVTQEAGVFSLSDGTSRKNMSIGYVEMPRGLARGVALCQVKRDGANESCSYIDNELVGYFFGRVEDDVWRGVLREQNADIILTLISKDQKNKNILIGVAESIRLKPQLRNTPSREAKI